MKLATLRQTLINFASNPNESWCKPTDGNGNPVDINTGKQARVTIEMADLNTARLNSGTYTKEQYDDFHRQLDQVERGIKGVAYFSGSPSNLPASIPERVCSKCGTTFRSVNTDEKVSCHKCSLYQLCPVLPGLYVTAYWRRDGWRMQAFGDTGFHNEMTFWWYNHNSAGNICHQGLVVHRTTEGTIRKLVFSTVAMEARRCYQVTFDVEANTVKCMLYNSCVVDNDKFAKSVEVKEIDNIVVDLMVAMLPSWMLYTHRPRNPANDCFATT